MRWFAIVCMLSSVICLLVFKGGSPAATRWKDSFTIEGGIQKSCFEGNAISAGPDEAVSGVIIAIGL